jgi:hypothetical protein
VAGGVVCVFGNRVGRSVRYLVPGGKALFANEYVAIVGASGSARKSTAADTALWLWSSVEPGLANSPSHCLGLGPGEVLIARVRDGGVLADGAVDPGVQDKRLLVDLDEFGLLFAAMTREASVLGDLLKIAFGGGTLQSSVKSNIQRATDAHVSVIGCTSTVQLWEALGGKRLRGRLRDGFVNRFVWVLATRSKRLPRLHPAQQRVAVAARDAVGRELRAGAEWDAWYNGLATPPHLSGVLARAETHVVKLAMAYACLDRSAAIGIDHLRAALAVWHSAPSPRRRSSSRYCPDATPPITAVRSVRPFVRRSSRPPTSSWHISPSTGVQRGARLRYCVRARKGEIGDRRHHRPACSGAPGRDCDRHVHRALRLSLSSSLPENGTHLRAHPTNYEPEASAYTRSSVPSRCWSAPGPT